MSTTKSVLITGCSAGGIGAALAQAFAARDLRVFATARDVSKMSALSDRPNITLLELDVTDDQHIARAVQAVSGETGGRLDFLINNAALNQFMPMLDDSIEEAKTLFDVNVWAPLKLSKAFSPMLITAKGTIVNISSVSGYINIPWMGTYAASKGALQIMAETLRLELRPFGVRVVSLVTATVDSKVFDHFDDFKLPDESIYKSIESTIRGRAQGTSAGKRMSPADYADKVVPSIIKGDQSGIVWGPGFTVNFVRYATAWLPQWILNSMWTKGTGVDEMLAHP